MVVVAPIWPDPEVRRFPDVGLLTVDLVNLVFVEVAALADVVVMVAEEGAKGASPVVVVIAV